MFEGDVSTENKQVERQESGIKKRHDEWSFIEVNNAGAKIKNRVYL